MSGGEAQFFHETVSWSTDVFQTPTGIYPTTVRTADASSPTFVSGAIPQESISFSD